MHVASTKKSEAPAGESKKPYSPPTVVPAQLKTDAGIRKAWTAVLSDIDDEKHKSAFVWWLPGFLSKHAKEFPELRKNYATPGSPHEDFLKGLLDHVAGRTFAARRRWYDARVAMMLKSTAPPRVGPTPAKKPK